MTEARRETDEARAGQLNREQIRERMEMSADPQEPSPVGVYQHSNAPRGASIGWGWLIVLILVILVLVFFAYQVWL